MKNLSLALNVVLLIAVGVLYYLHFSGTKTQKSAGATDSKDLKIAYINSDTVLKYYDYFKVNKDRLDAKAKKMDQDLQGRAQSLQNEFQSYQQNASTLTMGQARAVEEDLGKKRQNLQMYQENLSQQMLIEQEKMTKDLYDRVTTFLQNYSEQNGLKVVLKHDASSDLLFATEGLNISKEVIAGLNDQYKTELSKAPAKKDSTAAKKK
jgi:outer membrane protein